MPGTCLIGEADPFVARLLARFGEASGFEAVCARLGEEVVEVARRLQPQVIIVDAELPGKIRGWEAVQALHADSRYATIPLITCCWLPEAEAHALVGVAAGHLQKPDLHYEDFVAALRGAGLLVESLEREQSKGKGGK